MQSMQMPGVVLAVRVVFVGVFLIIAVLYALRVAGCLKSPHQDRMTDISHFAMAVAMCVMFGWPNWFM